MNLLPLLLFSPVIAQAIANNPGVESQLPSCQTLDSALLSIANNTGFLRQRPSFDDNMLAGIELINTYYSALEPKLLFARARRDDRFPVKITGLRFSAAWLVFMDKVNRKIVLSSGPQNWGAWQRPTRNDHASQPKAWFNWRDLEIDVVEAIELYDSAGWWRKGWEDVDVFFDSAEKQRVYSFTKGEGRSFFDVMVFDVSKEVRAYEGPSELGLEPMGMQDACDEAISTS